MLVDTGLEVAARYDAVMRLGFLRVVNRTVVGIGRDGRISFYRRGMPATDEILAAIAAPPGA